MSTLPTGLGYAGGRTGYAAQMNNHAFRGSSALSNMFGGGVNGQPTPGMYNNLGYAGGRTGMAANTLGQHNHAFRGTLGRLGQAASSNLLLTVGGLIVTAVVLEGFRTRKMMTGLKPVDNLMKGVADAVKPATKPVADLVGA